MLKRTYFASVFMFVGLMLGWAAQDLRWPSRVGAQSPLGNLPNSASPIPGALSPIPGSGVSPIPPSDLSSLTPEEQINVMVYEQRNLGVVNISTRSVRPDTFLTLAAVEGSGSGSVIDAQGHILTNHHVVDGARDINVTLYNGESFPAELVGQDPDNDIAVLKINAPGALLFPIPIGDSSLLRVGMRILAIGNPFGLERTMSDGIISSLNRQLPSRNRRTMKSIIQIDAALNQGNSGGPLLNTRGELIGMNTAIATSTGDNAGIGFSIPSNTIRRVVPQLIQYGRVSRPTIGITRVYETEEGIGLLVVNVTPGGPADQAGIRGLKTMRKQVRRAGFNFEQEVIDPSSADLIIGVDNIKVTKADDLLTAIENKKAGDQVVLSIVRKGKQVNVPVVLGASD